MDPNLLFLAQDREGCVRCRRQHCAWPVDVNRPVEILQCGILTGRSVDGDASGRDARAQRSNGAADPGCACALDTGDRADASGRPQRPVRPAHPKSRAARCSFRGIAASLAARRFSLSLCHSARGAGRQWKTAGARTVLILEENDMGFKTPFQAILKELGKDVQNPVLVKLCCTWL
jgi:hypothetical protein